MTSLLIYAAAMCAAGVTLAFIVAAHQARRERRRRADNLRAFMERMGHPRQDDALMVYRPTVGWGNDEVAR